MFCVNCGTQKNPDAKFCANCGTGSKGYQAQHDENQQQDLMSETNLPYDMPQATSDELAYVHPITPTTTTKKKNRALTVVAACVLATLLTVGGVFGFMLLNNPSLAVSRAVNNATSEISQRLSTSPFQAFELLMGSVEYGTLNVGFDYTINWTDWWTDEDVTTSYQGHFSLASDINANSYALRGSLQADDYPNLSFAAYISPERVALGSPQFSQDYFGFWFDSFRQDFMPFGRDILRMSNEEIDMFSNAIEEVGSWLARGNTPMEELEDYVNAFTAFLLAAESGSERGVEIAAGLETATVQRVDYVITIEALAGLLDTWIDIFEADDTVRAAFDYPMYHAMLGRNAFDDIVSLLRQGVRDLEDNISGYMTLSFYIGARNRLVQLALDATLTVDDREAVSFQLALNFGNSALDRWTFSGTATDSCGDDSFFSYWDITNEGDRYVNTWHIEYDPDDAFTLISDWNTSSGDFTFSYEEVTRWGAFAEDLLSGNYTSDGETFRLRFNHVNEWIGSTFDIEIYTTTGADIGADVTFINIDRWSDELLDRLDDMLWELGW